jgi:hypothetical protein
MLWNHYVAYFFAGFLFINALPHLAAGTMGRPFQSPFAKPPGEGLSSSGVNALWGSFNVIAGYLLLFHVGNFDPRDFACVAPLFVAMILGSLMLAKSFGRFYSGNDPLKAQADLPKITKG